MRKIFMLLLALTLTVEVFAQSPSKISYQAVIRDSNGQLVVDSPIGLRVSILQSDINGEEVYIETLTPQTNANGLLSVQIGSEEGFGLIDWAMGPYFIKTETDPTGGTNYTISGISQLLSVPYSLYANKSTYSDSTSKAEFANYADHSGAATFADSTSKAAFAINADYATISSFADSVANSTWSRNNNNTYYNNGNVGIGINAPRYSMDIVGNESTGNRTFLNIENIDNSNTSSAALEIKASSNTNYTVLRMMGDTYNYSWWGKHGQLKTLGDGLIIEATKADYSGGDIVFVNGSSSDGYNIKTVTMKIAGNGNVGVGTDSPAHKFDVLGTVNASEYLINGQPFQFGNSSSPWLSDSSQNIAYHYGNIGIGTNEPNSLLHISGDVAAGNRTFLNIENKSTSTTSSAALEVRAASDVNYTVLRMMGDTYDYSWWGKHGQLRTVGDGLIIEATKADYSGGDIVFVNGSTSDGYNIKTVTMKINGEGNVGIGTDAPKERLQIKSGDIYLEDVNSGVIMKSPDGNCWRMTVNNLGQPVFTQVTCQ